MLMSFSEQKKKPSLTNETFNSDNDHDNKIYENFHYLNFKTPPKS